MELIHNDFTWLGIGGPGEFDDYEEDEFEEKFVELRIIKNRKIRVTNPHK